MIEAAGISDAHSDCGCLLSVGRQGRADLSSHSFRYHGCQLHIGGLRVVIACDDCSAFGPNDTRPDLLVLRERDGSCEWIVIEIQRTMDRAAIPQVEAGLRTLAEDPLFADARDCRPRVLFASKHSVRTQDLQRLRKPLRSRGKPVHADIRRCGGASA